MWKEATYKDELNAGLSKVDVHLLNLVGNTGGIENCRDEVVDRTVTGPLREDDEETIASNTVTGRAGFEEGTIVPPALVATVHVQILLVLTELHADPDAVLIAVAVELGKGFLGLGLSAAGVQPTWTLM